MNRVGLAINEGKEEAKQAAARLIPWLMERGVAVALNTTGGEAMGRPDLVVPGWEGSDMLVVLGGDGTLLRATKQVAAQRMPVLGINTGHLGFLTETEGQDAEVELAEILAGNYRVEERMMIDVAVVRDGETVERSVALNDAVVTKAAGRLVNLSVTVGETPVVRYKADGVIVATPTGSTAYSLSAGGPIMQPNLQALLITPICPHTMNARALVTGADETVYILIENSEGLLSVDGRDPVVLRAGDRLAMRRSELNARLVRRHTYRFYEVLRQKLARPSWGST